MKIIVTLEIKYGISKSTELRNESTDYLQSSSYHIQQSTAVKDTGVQLKEAQISKSVQLPVILVKYNRLINDVEKLECM